MTTRHRCRCNCGMDPAECPHDDICYRQDDLGLFHALRNVVLLILLVYIGIKAFT